MTATSGVTLGYGTLVRIGRGSPAVWTTLKGVDDVNFPDQTPDLVDTTHFQSPGRTEEGIDGLNKIATHVVPLQYAPGSDTDVLLTSLLETREDVIFEITPSGGVPHRWAASVANYRMTAAPVKDKKMAELTLRVKAKIATGAPSAPVNSVLPAVSGMAEVGQQVVAWAGLWAPDGTYTYQWQRGSGGTFSNISAATSQTYTVASGDKTYALRCVVTATNTVGATSATSAPTTTVP